MRKIIQKSMWIMVVMVLMAAATVGIGGNKTANAATKFKITANLSGTYIISSKGNSNLTLGVSNYTTANVNITLQRRSTTETTQIIKVQRQSNGMYTLRILNSGKYIAIAQSGNGGRVWQSSTPTYFQIWFYNGYYYFYAPAYGKVLDVSGGNFRLNNRLWSYGFNGTDAQLFAMKSVSEPAPKFTVSELSAKKSGSYCTVSYRIRCSNYIMTSVYSVWNNSSRSTKYSPNTFSVKYSQRGYAPSKKTYNFKIYAGVGGNTAVCRQNVNVRVQ